MFNYGHLTNNEANFSYKKDSASAYIARRIIFEQCSV